MKKSALMLIGALLSLLLASCEGAATGSAATALPIETAAQTPAATAVPESAPTAGEAQALAYDTVTVYYPEGADASNAEYTLEYVLPVFGAGYDACKEMNASVSAYEDGLLERVASDRLPYSDGADGGAYTRVSCNVETADEYTVVIFSEEYSFGADVETMTRALVLGIDGSAESFASVTDIFEPDALAAQQVFNLIDADRGSYYGDVTLEDVSSALDLYERFYVTETGYAFLVSPGVLAPEESGELTFTVPRQAFYPDVVGEALTVEQYESLRPVLNDLTAACSMEYAGFDGGSPDAFISSAFMTRRLTTGLEDALYIEIAPNEYASLFASLFAGTLPEISDDAGDGTFVSDSGAYMIPVYTHEKWSMRIDDGALDGDSLTLSGMALSGEAGTGDASELCPITVTFTASADSPFGYRIASVELG